MQKFISICADDFGISELTSKGILDLINLSRISETSCIVTNNIIERNFIELKNLQEKVDIGLHITLTNLLPLTKCKSIMNNNNFISPNLFFFKNLVNQININEVKKEIIKQFDIFYEYFGFLPNFIDGHHHIHQFPLVINLIIECILEKYEKSTFRPWVRVTNTTINYSNLNDYKIKSLLLKISSLRIIKKLDSNNIKHNTFFGGVHNFQNNLDFENFFKKNLKYLENNSLFMVHPGYLDVSLKKIDTAVFSRKIEFDYLQSNNFISDLKNNNFTIRKMSECL